MAPSVITRADFIQQAGGVLKSELGYQDWAGTEKWDNFWAFFVETQHEWVTSLYA